MRFGRAMAFLMDESEGMFFTNRYDGTQKQRFFTSTQEQFDDPLHDPNKEYFGSAGMVVDSYELAGTITLGLLASGLGIGANSLKVAGGGLSLAAFGYGGEYYFRQSGDETKADMAGAVGDVGLAVASLSAGYGAIRKFGSAINLKGVGTKVSFFSGLTSAGTEAFTQVGKNAFDEYKEKGFDMQNYDFEKMLHLDWSDVALAGGFGALLTPGEVDILKAFKNGIKGGQDYYFSNLTKKSEISKAKREMLNGFTLGIKNFAVYKFADYISSYVSETLNNIQRIREDAYGK